MIDIANTSTYPKELEDCILNYLAKMPNDIIEGIPKNKIKCKSDIKCTIEFYLSPYKAISLYENLIQLLQKYDFILYHATKTIDESVFFKNGLQVNEWNHFHRVLRNVFNQVGFDKTTSMQILSKVEQEHKRKGYDKVPQLCFFSGLDLIDYENGKHGYESFCLCIGGEITRSVLQKDFPNKYKIFSAKGKAGIVKFKFSFKDILLIDKEKILYEFICHYIAKKFFNFFYSIKFDGITYRNIPSTCILDFIPITFEIIP